MLKKFILPASILLLAACGDDGVDEEINDEEDDIIVEEESAEAEGESADDADDIENTDGEDSAGNNDPAETESTEEAADENSEAGAETEEDLDEVADESIEEEEIDVASVSEDKVAFELVKEDTFTNEIGQGVWEKYQQMTEDYEMKDVFKPEDSGSTRAEIEDMMSDMELEPDSLDMEGGYTLIIYHFPDDELAHDNGDPFIMADVTYVFDPEDNLIYSSIAPGYYEVELSDAPTADGISQVSTMSELSESHDPEVFTIGEMVINEATITQTMIPVDSEDNTLGLYIYALGDSIIYSNGDLFFTVGADFPTYSFMYFQELVQAYSEM